MKVTKLQELKKEIGDIISNAESMEFPVEIFYNRGIEHCQFKITIEEYEEDFFIDSKGTKWMKMKEKEQD